METISPNTNIIFKYAHHQHQLGSTFLPGILCFNSDGLFFGNTRLKQYLQLSTLTKHMGVGLVGRWAGGQVGRWAGGQVGRWADRQVGRWAGGQAGRWACRQVGWRTGRQADTLTMVQLQLLQQMML